MKNKRHNLRLGELLLYTNKINYNQLEIAIQEQKNSTKKIGQILMDKGWITEEDIMDALEKQLGFTKVDLSTYNVNQKIVNMIPESMARKYNLIPIDEKSGKLIVAMEDPLNLLAKDDVRLYTKMELEPVIAAGEDISNLINRYFTGQSTRQVLEEFEHNEIIYEYDDLEDEELIEVTSAPIVRLLNSIVEQAVRNKASDIHVEPYSNEVRIRIRVDGDLQKIMTLPKNNLSPIITRIKIIGKMNIAEKRIPQDGRVETIINGKEIDMRISTLPTVYGEKAVIRLLDKAGLSFTKESLGFNTENLKVFNEILYQPYGMILVTGPTGSGKTTTLYTALRELNTMEKNIITVEDPVEYKLDGINQVQVNAKAGLTFATGLRSILRQDPDIIMIGEIRDSETAEMAIRAAITGHLVLSTLHTNDSPSAVARLVDMGVEPYLVSSAVIGIMSQRLIKVLCNNCKKAYEASYAEKKFLNYPVNQDLTLYSAIGCNTCNQGYRGRVGVHEIMPIDAKMRRLIDKNVNIEDLREAAIKSGMVPLTEAVMNLAIEGRTSFDEVVKVGFTL